MSDRPEILALVLVRAMSKRRIAGVLVGVLGAACGGPEDLLVEGQEAATTDGLTYLGADAQFHPSFSTSTPYGGFGGGNCTARKTPVIFLPGNGDPAKNWDFPPSTGVPSVYETFKAAGYNDCELFGVDYLTPDERETGLTAYHTRARAELIADFILDVLAYTGANDVDVISHSLGVTQGLEALRQFGLRSRVRRFIGISAGMRGLASCYYAGYANPAVPVCGSANWFDPDTFGFYPHSWFAYNPRMGNGGFRDDPRQAPSTRFYTIRAGYHDQVHCTTATYYSGCYRTAMFDDRSNVFAQVDVGEGATAGQLDFDFSDWSPYALGAGDTNGVGHFRAKNNTGVVQVQMLNTDCTGTSCCGPYSGACSN